MNFSDFENYTFKTGWRFDDPGPISFKLGMMVDKIEFYISCQCE